MPKKPQNKNTVGHSAIPANLVNISSKVNGVFLSSMGIYDEARTKFILGKLDEAGRKQAIEQWRKAGGDKNIEEFSAQFAKSGQ